jgi:hypothetical protein
LKQKGKKKRVHDSNEILPNSRHETESETKFFLCKQQSKSRVSRIAKEEQRGGELHRKPPKVFKCETLQEEEESCAVQRQ